MGASDWVYIEPFAGDVGEALQCARHRAYKAGDYVRDEDWDEDDSINSATTGGVGGSMGPLDVLLTVQAESGTHSIIDMTGGVSDEPRFGTVSPLQPDQLVAAFGTLTPKPEDVLIWAKAGGVDSVRSRWEGVYIITGPNEPPSSIAFAGFSGD